MQCAEAAAIFFSECHGVAVFLSQHCSEKIYVQNKDIYYIRKEWILYMKERVEYIFTKAQEQDYLFSIFHGKTFFQNNSRH